VLAVVGGVFYSPTKIADAKSRESQNQLNTEVAQLTTAPNVPPPITRKHPVKVQVDFTTQVQELFIDPVNKYSAWTFNGTVPAPFIRARVGDVLQVNLTNKDANVSHNVDMHAITGPGGGSKVLTADFGDTRSADFKLLYPGLFIYHCAVEPTPVHIANGMYGLLLVEPEEGLEKVDKEFYILQSEFYTTPTVDNPRLLELAENKALKEIPSHVVLNGRSGSMTETEGMLRAKAGDRIRVFFGNAGPNLVASHHILGCIFDKVYREGDLISPPARGVQTTLVPAGGAAVVEFNLPVPGVFTIVDHSIFRTEKGCFGYIAVDGETRPDIYYAPGNPLTCVGCKLHP